MSEFKREDRYIIIKRSDLKKVPVAYCSALVDPMFSLLSHLPRRECVVVEHDWPEYHLVWAMIEHRMAGKPVPDFNLWRRADALQALLTAADERADVLEGWLRRWSAEAGGVFCALKYETDAALKPAEDRNEPNCLRCLDKKTVPSNLAEGYVMDCPDCCSEEG